MDKNIEIAILKVNSLIKDRPVYDWMSREEISSPEEDIELSAGIISDAAKTMSDLVTLIETKGYTDIDVTNMVNQIQDMSNYVSTKYSSISEDFDAAQNIAEGAITSINDIITRIEQSGHTDIDMMELKRRKGQLQDILDEDFASYLEPIDRS